MDANAHSLTYLALTLALALTDPRHVHCMRWGCDVLFAVPCEEEVSVTVHLKSDCQALARLR